MSNIHFKTHLIISKYVWKILYLGRVKLGGMYLSRAHLFILMLWTIRWLFNWATTLPGKCGLNLKTRVNWLISMWMCFTEIVYLCQWVFVYTFVFLFVFVYMCGCIYMQSAGARAARGCSRPNQPVARWTRRAADLLCNGSGRWKKVSWGATRGVSVCGNVIWGVLGWFRPFCDLAVEDMVGAGEGRGGWVQQDEAPAGGKLFVFVIVIGIHICVFYLKLAPKNWHQIRFS